MTRIQHKRTENLITTVDAPTPEQFYFDSSRRYALKELWFGLSSGEVGLLTGESGLGKTLLCRELLRRLPMAVHSVYMVAPRDEHALMDNILQSMAMIRKVHCSAESRDASALEPLLHWAIIIDEAQRLDAATIQSLAAWRDHEAGQGRSIGLLLVGPPTLEQTLTLPALQSFNSQITMRCELPVFPRSETEAYINHWLKSQWHTARLDFSESANRVVHYATGGIPQHINRVCTHAVDSARVRQKSSVTALSAVRAVWQASSRHQDTDADGDTIDTSMKKDRVIDTATDAYPKTVRLSDLN